jgi:hypothetical protein
LHRIKIAETQESCFAFNLKSEVDQIHASAFPLFQSIVGGKSSVGEIGFSLIIHHSQFVIPTGGTAPLAVPERRNPSLASEFRFKRGSSNPRGELAKRRQLDD